VVEIKKILMEIRMEYLGKKIYLWKNLYNRQNKADKNISLSIRLCERGTIYEI